MFEEIRKAVNCPPQPQRCSLTKSSTAAPVTQSATTTTTTTISTITYPVLNPFAVLWCPYLQSDFGNKDFLQSEYSFRVSISQTYNTQDSKFMILHFFIFFSIARIRLKFVFNMFKSNQLKLNRNLNFRISHNLDVYMYLRKLSQGTKTYYFLFLLY